MTDVLPGRHSEHLPSLTTAVLAGLLLSGCFNGADVGAIYCVTNDNCPEGYVCEDSSKPGGCRQHQGTTLDSGASDTTSRDGAASLDGASGVDAEGLVDSRTVDGGLDNDATSTAVDGPMLDGAVDTSQLLPDASDVRAADAPVDAPSSDSGVDGSSSFGGVDGNTGTGGAIGSDGATGTGGSAGAGGGTGNCGIRDCTSSNDNDCNGTADNQEVPCKVCIPGNSQACSTGASGICAAGTQTCQLATDHQSVGFGACSQSAAKGSRDCTSSNDNDCNGKADNTESTFCQCSPGGSPRSCATGSSGICSAGSQACVVSADKSSSAWGTCTQTTPKGTETCANPGTDDNCDGIVDNVPIAACNVGTGLGACANGGYTACSGLTQVCNAAVSTMGDATVLHTGPAPNGSWDWDCDGVVTKEFPDTAPPPPTCTGLDMSVCASQPQRLFALNPFACGDTGDIGQLYCYWLDLIPGCTNKTGTGTGYQQRCR